MSSVLKLTLATGEVQEVPFFPTSTISVATSVAGGADIARSYTDVVAVELVQIDDVAAAAASGDSGLSSPGAVIVYAKELALADAAAYIERAVLRWPADENLAQVQRDLHAAIQAGAETWSTSVEVDPDEITGEPGPDAWLDNPATAAAQINSVQTVDEAQELLATALAKWPTDEALLELKARADAYEAGDQEPANVEEV